MKCLKKVIIGFGIFLPALLSVLFVSPSYAVSDYSGSLTLPASSTYICSQWNTPVCSDYSYLILDLSNLQSANPSSSDYFMLSFGGGNNTYYPYRLDYVVLDLSSNVTDVIFGNSSSSLSGFSLSFTLTDSLGEPCSCPEPEEPEPCPVVPETPYGDQLNNITLAIYTCGGILLVLYFFYCIYRIIIKNSGVSNL